MFAINLSKYSMLLLFYITFYAYFHSIPIIKEIEQHKECAYRRTSEEKAFKNPDILED